MHIPSRWNRPWPFARDDQEIYFQRNFRNAYICKLNEYEQLEVTSALFFDENNKLYYSILVTEEQYWMVLRPHLHKELPKFNKKLKLI